MSGLRQIYSEGMALTMQGESEAALRKFKEALKLQSSDDLEKHWVSSCHFSIAVIHYGRGDMLKAKRSWLKYIKEGGPEPWTYLTLADISENRGEHAAARRYYGRCEELATLQKDKDLLQLLAKRKRPRRTRRTR